MISHKQKLYRLEETPLLTADVPAEVIVEGLPQFHWKGGKCALVELWKFVSFARWAHKEGHGEVQSRTYYDPVGKTHHQVVFPQTGSGASTNEIKDHVDRAVALAGVPDGAIQVMTTHSHPGFGAFQSSVDTADETGQDGLHLTVGWKDEASHQLDARVVYSKVQYAAILSEWFVVGESWHNQPLPIQEAALKYWTEHVPANVVFPEEWKTRIHKVEVRATYYPAIKSNAAVLWNGYTGYGHEAEKKTIGDVLSAMFQGPSLNDLLSVWRLRGKDIAECRDLIHGAHEDLDEMEKEIDEIELNDELAKENPNAESSTVGADPKDDISEF